MVFYETSMKIDTQFTTDLNYTSSCQKENIHAWLKQGSTFLIFNRENPNYDVSS